MDNYKNRYSENPEILKRDTEKLYALSQYIPMEVNFFYIFKKNKLDYFI